MPARRGAGAVKVPEDKLRSILAKHQRWLKTNGAEGQEADLQEADLRGAILNHANLEAANLQGAHFRGTDLQGAVLGVANLTGADLRDTNLKGVHLNRANLQRVDLRKADLQEARLVGAKLQEANLGSAKLRGADLTSASLRAAILDGANLQGAVLKRANLEESSLESANLEGAMLEGANLQRTNLHDANLKGAMLLNATFRDANLKDAKLIAGPGDPVDDATALSGEQLAGADVSGVSLPDDIAAFDGLGQVEEASKNARKLFLSVLLGCGYAWLTIATTTDARLLTNSASSPLPIIQVEIPIAWFYWAAPVILLGLYVYFHFYMQRMWEGLATLPAVFPDGKPLHRSRLPQPIRWQARLLIVHSKFLSCVVDLPGCELCGPSRLRET